MTLMRTRYIGNPLIANRNALATTLRKTEPPTGKIIINPPLKQRGSMLLWIDKEMDSSTGAKFIWVLTQKLWKLGRLKLPLTVSETLKYCLIC